MALEIRPGSKESRSAYTGLKNKQKLAESHRSVEKLAEFEILGEEGTNDVCIQLLRNYATIRDCMNRLMREEE